MPHKQVQSHQARRLQQEEDRLLLCCQHCQQPYWWVVVAQDCNLRATDGKSGSHTDCLQKPSATAKETRLWLIESLAAVRLPPPPVERLQRFKAPLIDADKHGALLKALLRTFVVQCPHQVRKSLA